MRNTAQTYDSKKPFTTVHLSIGKGFQIVEQYSNFGLTRLVYALSFTLDGQCLRFLFRKPSTFDAFLQVWSMCKLYLRLLLRCHKSAMGV
jgi:hypothetical protein